MDTCAIRADILRGAPKRRRGSILLWALGLNAIVFLYLMGSFPFFQTVVRVPARSYLTDQALALAESGLAHGLWQVNEGGDPSIPSNWTNFGWTDVSSSQSQQCVVNLGATICYSREVNLTAGDPSNKPVGTYLIFVAVNPTTNNSNPVLIATGSFPNATSPTTQQKIRADLERVLPDFHFAGFGHERIHLTGAASVDSYDSNSGPYGGLNVSQQGDIGTDDAGGFNPDLLISLDPFYVVNGNAYVPTGNWSQIDAGDLAGLVVTQPAQQLPSVIIPSSLGSLGVTTTTKPGWSGFGYSGAGDFNCGGTCTCSTAVRVKGLYVTGTLNMDTGCQILIDRCAGGTCMSTPGGTLNTDASGRLMKTAATEVTQIFLRDGDSSLDGGGVQWSSSIPQADRRPERLQIYATGTGAAVTLAMKPHVDGSPFYGVVYVDNGDLAVTQGSENAGLYDTEYFGAFVAGKLLNIYGNGGKQALIHYDRALQGLKLDGTGRIVNPGEGVYRIRTWQVQD